MERLLQKLGMPPDFSVHGHEVDEVIILTHWLMAILFVGWTIFFIYTLIRFRQKRQPKASHVGVKSHLSSYLEISVAVIETILLIGFSIPIWAKRSDKFPDRKDAAIVRVVAEQFAWNIHYPGTDGVFGKTGVKFMDRVTNPVGIDPNDPNGKDDFTTINQLHLPIHKPIIARLSSKDVIHCFALPVMRVKQDVMPGMEIPVWFEAKKSGKFHIACAQLCGLGHYRMKGYLTLHEPEAYATWEAEEVKKKQQETEGDSQDDFWN